MKRKTLTIMFIAAFCLASIGSIFGQSRQMYSWTDEDGVVHFSDQMPEGQDIKVIDIPEPAQEPASSPYQPVDAAADAAAEPSAAQIRREELAKSRQKRAEEQALNDAECAAKRAEVERLEPHRRVFFTNEKGETERMDDVVRTERVAEAKAFIRDNCN